MKKTYSLLFFILSLTTVYAYGADNALSADTSEVNSLNKNGYNSRLTKPSQTIVYADKALKIAQKINYLDGQAEAYRIKGIGEYYLNRSEIAINNYLNALKYYKLANNPNGIAKVYNNIGNLYQEVDYERALEYFQKAEDIAEKTHNEQLIASLNLNIGNVYFRKNSFNQALKYCELSHEQFKKLGNKVFLVQCLQDLGAIYFHLNDIDKAESLLLEANKNAKAQDLNLTIASLNLKLTDIYIKKNKFAEAEKYLEEGKTFAQLVNNDKYINDYKFTSYELEFKRKNYKKALTYLQDIYKQDSLIYSSNNQTKFGLIYKELSIEQEHQRAIAQAEKDQDISRLRFWLVVIVAALLMVVIALLMGNVKRKAVTNGKLQELNDEISRQKDNLDRINHHLEEIIDERTKDLQTKNKKLSEYSSYLSHQIRGPIATLKGLMNLEKEGLVDQQECINMMDKCVSEIDEKIIEMSDMLHDPGKAGF
jgi:tetratricopeptide (TPR) repeat protein